MAHAHAILIDAHFDWNLMNLVRGFTLPGRKARGQAREDLIDEQPAAKRDSDYDCPIELEPEDTHIQRESDHSNRVSVRKHRPLICGKRNKWKLTGLRL